MGTKIRPRSGTCLQTERSERGKKQAIFVAKVIVDEAIGGGCGNQAVVPFKNDPVTVSDVLAAIDRLCGGSLVGWQRLQKKAGIQPVSGA
jgi:hypothetical protein